MANTYKTPGVYVEEISKLPASVAPVATAIPAFIGYTEKASKNNKDIYNVPTRITSLAEYELWFGGGPALKDVEVKINDADAIIETTFKNDFVMFDSIRLFYRNGGGTCYVVSVGAYSGGVAYADLKGGLDTVERIDEVTLLLFPDSVNADLPYDVQADALNQCANLQDRFAILDVVETPGKTALENAGTFRDKIGINNLSYGAAYTPFLQAVFPKALAFNQLKVSRGGVQIPLKNLTNNTVIQDIIDQTDQAYIASDMIENGNGGLVKGRINLAKNGVDAFPTIRDAFNALRDTYNTAAPSTAATVRDGLRPLYDKIVDMAIDIQNYRVFNLDFMDFQLETAIANKIPTLSAALQDLIDHSHAWVSAGIIAETGTPAITDSAKVKSGTQPLATATGAASSWGLKFPGTAVTATVYPQAALVDKIAAAGAKALEVFSIVNAAYQDIVAKSAAYVATFETSLTAVFPLYKSFKVAVNNAAAVLPPSGAIAGVYSAVDASRGVWKAPANVSLSGVTALTYNIDNKEQENLNVDVNAGKSVNAIRFFTGKGNLVWGARTLAGNDNEWRYVPVRRLFIMVEESIEKAMEPVVFEPNDANTWQKVKGTIANFLTGLWRDGALTGSKADEAFFVQAGLGSTMTEQDILEGRLIIEVGISAVRPAEFIILRFSHKLQSAS
jgi:hypothetical protein